MSQASYHAMFRTCKAVGYNPKRHEVACCSIRGKKAKRYINITEVVKARKAEKISDDEAQKMFAEIKHTNPANAEMLKKDIELLCSIADEFNGAVYVRADNKPV